MEILFELIVQVVLEVLLQVIFQVAAGLGWESLKNAARTERKAYPVLAGIGHFLLGLLAGSISLLVVPFRLTTVGIPGTSLIVAPLVTGLVSASIGRWLQRRGKDRPTMFTFQGGALFAFAMALVRWVDLVLEWSPFQ